MKSYRVEIIPRSAWGGPLQADTLFGHLCWALVYTEGENALRDFLRLFETPEPPLVLSNGFLKGCLPRPLLPPVTMALERRNFEVVKQLKRVTLLDEEWLLATR